MKSFIRLALLVAVVGAPSVAQAAIEASSKLTISNFLVTKFGGGSVVLGTDIDFGGLSQFATARAVMNGVVDQNNVNIVTNPPFGTIDAPVATSNGVAAGTPIAVENSFTTAGLPDPFALADTAGSGDILIGPGATATSFSAVGVDNVPFAVDSGTASNSSTAISGVITTFGALDLVFDFDYLLDITLDNSVPPPGTLTGSSSFTVSLTGAGIGVGGANVSSFTFAPGVLNSGLIVNGTTGIVDHDAAGHLTSPVISLSANGTYQFTLSQATTASAGPYVPEPTTIAIWGLLGMCSLSATARRRK